jgi:hypothetical protein
MMQVSAQQFISEAVERDKARYLHRTLRAGGARQTRKALPAPVVEETPERAPLWRDAETRFDAHMADYRKHLFNQARKIDAYIERRAVELGFTYEEMVGNRRFRPLTYARQLIWWELKTSVKPDATWKELGRAMGNKDHSSAFHGYYKIEALKAQEAK